MIFRKAPGPWTISVSTIIRVTPGPTPVSAPIGPGDGEFRQPDKIFKLLSSQGQYGQSRAAPSLR